MIGILGTIKKSNLCFRHSVSSEGASECGSEGSSEGADPSHPITFDHDDTEGRFKTEGVVLMVLLTCCLAITPDKRDVISSMTHRKLRTSFTSSPNTKFIQTLAIAI